MTDDTESATSTDESHEDRLPTDVREGLRDATIPLAATDPTSDAADLASDAADLASDAADLASDAADLAPVGERLADAAIVGLGESTHGTREFFELKHRILRHLVVEHGVRAVALESNLPETMALYDYVVHGEGDARTALASVHVGCWKVESVLSMVEWLRAFNADRPLNDRVAFYGFTGHSTHGAAERLRDHLDAVDPDVLDDVAADLATVDGEVDDASEWIAAAERVVPTLRDHFDERRGAHVAATSERAWARARRYVAVIEQVQTKTEALGTSERGAREAMDRAEYLHRIGGAGLPGHTMTDNVAWIRDHADVDTLVVWAHDAHLNRVAFTLPTVDAAAPSLGRQLAERHGDDYYALGFSFAHGAFQAVSAGDDQPELREQHLDGPLPDTLDDALHGLDEPLAFVDLRAAREDERTADWLVEPRPGFRTGGTFHPDALENHLAEYVYADAFDGLCFVAETTRARPIDTESDPDGDREDHRKDHREDDAERV